MSRHLDGVLSISRAAYACKSLSNNDMCRSCSDSTMTGGLVGSWTGPALYQGRRCETRQLAASRGRVGNMCVVADPLRLKKVQCVFYSARETHMSVSAGRRS